ncbi:MAG: hypothetical protein SNJ81_19255, partial [Cyanobacteriota bacterium]
MGPYKVSHEFLEQGFWRSPLISQHQNPWAIALHLPTPEPLGDRPSSPNTRTPRRSPPDISRNLELLTQAYRNSRFAAHPKAVG